VTGVIDRLERAKLVRRERDAVDRRKVYVKVLPAALKAALTYYGSFEKQMKGLVDGYTSDQLSFLIDYFVRSREIIVREIQKLDEKAEQTLPRKRSPAAQRRSSAHIGTEPGN
jgi:DNA-binding MarR family transcriptional regulator